MLTSLRSRLIAVYLGLIVIGFGGLTVIAGRQIANSAYDDFGSRLQIYTVLLASQLIEPLEHQASDVLDYLQAAADGLGANVTVFTPEGELWLEAGGEGTAVYVPASLERFVRQNSPEGEDSFYASAEVRDGDTLLAYVQIASSSAEPQETVQERWLALLGGFIGFSLVGLIVTLWLLATMTQPLSQLQRTALQLADGDLSERVPDPSADEIGSVGHAFNQMADQIEAMVQEQRAFTSNASHELRIPLTTIQLRTEWLKSGELDEATETQYVDEIDSEVKRLGNLVNDLLLLSRLDAHRLEIGQEQVDVGRLAKAVVNGLAEKAVAKQVEVNLDTAVSLLPVQANMTHLRVVIRNLMENAVKYTQNGGHVDCQIAQLSDKVQIVVRDNGQGIAPDDLPHIVKRFYRSDKAHSREIDGVGLGLALVGSIIDLYGGSFDVVSDGVGRGTAVTVQWPIMQ